MQRTIGIALLLMVVSGAGAQEKTSPEMHAGAIRPFLDDQTVLVVRIDLKRLDPQALVQKLVAIGKLPESDTTDLGRVLTGAHKTLRDAGAREVFVVVSLLNVLYDPVVVVVPLPQGADGDAIAQGLRPLMKNHGQEVRKIGGAVVGGQRSTLERLGELRPIELPELSKGFAAAGDTVIQVIGLLPPALRRSLEETMPNLPVQAGGGPIKTVTRGFDWVAVSAEVAPKLVFRMTVQARDAESARSLEKLMGDILQAVRKEKKMPAGLAEILQSFMPKLDGDRLTLNVGEKDLSRTLVPLLINASESQRRVQSINDFKQIASALHSYHDVHKAFPAHASYDKQGRPLLSWRVHLLPYLDQQPLFNEFHLDEPWDSEHNKKLIGRIPAVLRSPLSRAEAGKTTFLAPLGKGLMFPPGPAGVRVTDVPDGTSHTLFVVEVDDKHAVEWTRPDDLKVDLKQPFLGLAGERRGWFVAAFADGSVRVLQRSIAPATLRALFTRNGGEPIPPY